MTTPSKAVRLALTAAICGAVALPASNAAAGEKTERAILGALLGGLAGAALSNGDGGAAAIGAVAGAALGASTAKDRNRTVHHRSSRSSRAYYSDARYDRAPRYDSRDGYSYGYGDPYGRYDARYAYGR